MHEKDLSTKNNLTKPLFLHSFCHHLSSTIIIVIDGYEFHQEHQFNNLDTEVTKIREFKWVCNWREQQEHKDLLRTIKQAQSELNGGRQWIKLQCFQTNIGYVDCVSWNRNLILEQKRDIHGKNWRIWTKSSLFFLIVKYQC